MIEIAEPFGPNYPALPSAAKHRRAARDGLASMTRDERQAYGLAVETAIRALQRSELARATPEHRVSCASGTNHNDGAAIHKAMRAKHRAALLAAPSAIRKARTPKEWANMYAEAMAEKNSRNEMQRAA